MEAVEQVEHNGSNIRVVQDEDPDSPRECWDNLGTILYVSTHYTLGDKQVSADEIREVTERDDVIWLPVYAYIHGGITISTSRTGFGFQCPWDSGQCGIIYVEKDAAQQEFGKTYSEETIRKVLEAEVSTFDQYLTGDIYGYVVEKDGEHIESCWGFYGTEGVEDALGQAKAAADWEAREAEHAACRNG